MRITQQKHSGPHTLLENILFIYLKGRETAREILSIDSLSTCLQLPRLDQAEARILVCNPGPPCGDQDPRT